MSTPVKAGDQITGEFLVLKSAVRLTKAQKPYIDLDLRAVDGTVFEGCKRWGFAENAKGVILIQGTVEEFNGSLQIKINTWEPGELQTKDFQARCPWPLEVAELVWQFGNMLDEILVDRIRDFTEDFITHWSCHRFPTMEACPKRFFEHPGAQRIHHAYRHGLAEHTLEVMEHAHDIAECHEIQDYERSLLIAGCAMHDIGKLEEFHLVDGVYEFTPLGKAYGWNSNAHLHIGSQMFAVYTSMPDHGLTFEECQILQNIILGHHGEFGITEPKYIISMIAHLADLTSYNVNRMKMNLALTPGNEVSRDRVGKSYLPIIEPRPTHLDEDEEPK